MRPFERHELTGVHVWDGERGLGPCDLSWSGDRIESVTSADDQWPELCVIPGLVDTHVHLAGRASIAEAPRPDDTLVWPLVTTREEQVLHAAANAQRAMRHGVTTLRDLAADEVQIAVQRAFDAEIMLGPRVLASGPVGMTAGHHDLFVPPAHPVRSRTADGPDECRKLVRTWARAGLTGIKIFTSGGVLSTGDKVGWRNHTSEEIRSTIDEAHALGMLVAAHAHSPEGIQVAMDEGVDSIEHATEMTDTQVATLAEYGTPVAPTLLINDLIAQGSVPVAAESQEKAERLVVSRDTRFRAAAQAGVRFVLGTDASGYFLAFGDQMAEAVRMANVISLDAERTLRAATSDAAASLGLSQETGRISPGLSADFVILRGRPWERIDDLSTANIVAVVCRGRLAAGNLPHT
ncbi:MAG: amidohydrolase family protein [Streptosporangiales bacterium]